MNDQIEYELFTLPAAFMLQHKLSDQVVTTLGEKNALEELYIKMYETSTKGSLTTSETIMSALGPFDGEPQEDQSDGEMVFNLLDVSLEDRSS